MPAARRDSLPRPPVVDGPPFGNDVEIGADLKQFLEQERASFTGQLLQRENLDVVVVEAQVPTMCFKLGVAELEVEIPAAREVRAKNFEGAEIDEAPQHAESFFGPLQLDLDEIAELPNQTRNLLADEQMVAVNLCTEKRALLVAREECQDIAQR